MPALGRAAERVLAWRVWLAVAADEMISQVMLCDGGRGLGRRLGRDDACMEADVLDDDEPASSLLRDLNPAAAHPGCAWTLTT